LVPPRLKPGVGRTNWNPEGSLVMDGPNMLDELFCAAVAAIDAGDVTELERLVTAHPTLVRDRLDAPAARLRDKVGAAPGRLRSAARA
jgi:hypothetical protein